MAYKRKTVDRWDIETNYGYGWETECSYDRYEDLKADFEEYKLHVQHHGGMLRIRKRRERI